MTLPLVQQQLDLCEQLCCKFQCVVIDSKDREPNVHEMKTTLRAIVPDQNGSGVKFAIESHDRFNSKTLASIVIGVCDPAVAICLDIVNSLEFEGSEVVVKTFAPFVVNLRLKDRVVRRASHLMGFEIARTPAGYGSLVYFSCSPNFAAPPQAERDYRTLTGAGKRL